MMNRKIYIDNLAAATTDDDLRDLFSPYGNVAEVNVSVNHANGRSRGFGFVTMATPEGARTAIRALHGKERGSRALTVSEAWPHEERTGEPGTGRVPGTVPAGAAEPPIQGAS